MSNRPLDEVRPDPDGAKPGVLPWTSAQAEALRRQSPPVSVGRVLGYQALATAVLFLLAWVVVGKASVAVSVGYGGLSVVVPTALFARGLASRSTKTNPMAAVAGLVIWEAAKIGLMLAMLLMAHSLVEGLSWPALLVGFVAVMKVYWLALVSEPRFRNFKA